eukprot:scaffold3226_cov251-Pinguiococcus_pyrenoidosus.AAC.4
MIRTDCLGGVARPDTGLCDVPHAVRVRRPLQNHGHVGVEGEKQGSRRVGERGPHALDSRRGDKLLRLDHLHDLLGEPIALVGGVAAKERADFLRIHHERVLHDFTVPRRPQRVRLALHNHFRGLRSVIPGEGKMGY